MKTEEKYELLKENLLKYGSLAVAFSAGIDSALLTLTAHRVLKDNMIAVTAVSPLMPKAEIEAAKEFCQKNGIKHILCPIDNALKNIKDNPKDRCYICKKQIMKTLLDKARENGINYLAEGSNMDDISDYRPGAKAIAELGLLSPLKQAGLTKADIREIARLEGIPFWNKPAYACLATRFPCGSKLTEEKLKAVEAAEDYLHKKGFLQIRVRCHENLARIEAADEYFERLLNKGLLKEIDLKLKSLGFRYVSLDLGGYKTGNMN